MIFASNHLSHMDTPLLLTTLPVEFRHRTVVAAASDYFFDRTWKAVLSSFALATIPIERSKVNRKSGDTAAELIEDGWNLVIFPEGVARPTAGPSRSRPVPPTWPGGLDDRSCPSTCTAPGMSCPRVPRPKRERREARAPNRAQQPLAPRPDRRALRRPALPGRRREHPPILRPDRGRRRHPVPGGPLRLVAGPAFGQRRGARRRGRDRAPGTGGLALATGLGARRAPVTGAWVGMAGLTR